MNFYKKKFNNIFNIRYSLLWRIMIMGFMPILVIFSLLYMISMIANFQLNRFKYNYIEKSELIVNFITKDKSLILKKNVVFNILISADIEAIIVTDGDSKLILTQNNIVPKVEESLDLRTAGFGLSAITRQSPVRWIALCSIRFHRISRCGSSTAAGFSGP